MLNFAKELVERGWLEKQKSPLLKVVSNRGEEYFAYIQRNTKDGKGGYEDFEACDVTACVVDGESSFMHARKFAGALFRRTKAGLYKGQGNDASEWWTATILDNPPNHYYFADWLPDWQEIQAQFGSSKDIPVEKREKFLQLFQQELIDNLLASDEDRLDEIAEFRASMEKDFGPDWEKDL